MRKYVHLFIISAAILSAGALTITSIPSTTRYVRASQPAGEGSAAAQGEPATPRAADPAPLAAANPPAAQKSQKKTAPAKGGSLVVPFYSQFKDISSAKWQKVGCGVASLAMIIDYYEPAVPVDTLLDEAIALGAYQSNAGWTYAGLIATSKKYGMKGAAYDFTGSDSKAAYQRFTTALEGGPVIASVHYKFDPKSTIPHLVVIERIKDGVVYYNDPAEKSGQKQISVAAFRAAWKQRYIVIRPAANSAPLAIAA